jgi:hypothetical protein
VFATTDIASVLSANQAPAQRNNRRTACMPVGTALYQTC